MAEDFVALMQAIAPEMAEAMARRAMVLTAIAESAPVGRRQLALRLNLAEREVRADVEKLRDAGLITLDKAGMNPTPNASRWLESARSFARQTQGLTALETALMQVLPVKTVFVAPGDADADVRVLSDVGRLAAQGVREFTLIAQDTTRYGTDGGEESQLPQLIEEIAAIEGVEWLRALYCYPERVDERLLDTMKRLPNVCDYLDLPMQHISQHILTDMNRTDTSAHIRKVCRMFKERGMMLRTTLMVGFPGETDEDFEELMDFVAETKFDRMGAFMFCPEDGTRAADMPNQVPEEVKQERYDRLMTLQHGISLAQNKARVGTTCRVLVEKKRGSRYVGRSEFEAPETDGNIFFNSEEPCEIGTFVNVKITGAKAYDLMGERV